MNDAPPASFRLAVAQPRIDRSIPEEARVDDAVAMIAQAGREGAQLVLFPESFPGPISADRDYDAAPAIAEAAGGAGCAVCWGRVERREDGRLCTVAFVLDADGSEQLRYVRSHPATGDVHPILSGGPMAPGDRLGLAQVAGIRFGVAICSELWIPEIARSLALSGAEVILAPAGGGFHRVASNWRLIARARAIENNCHVALTQQLFDGEAGAALIAGPERVEAESAAEGLIFATLDLERSRWLASTDDSMTEPKQFDSLPGMLRARRPELYGELVRARENLYDYDGKSRGEPA